MTLTANPVSVTWWTKTDMSRWTRAHAGDPGISWSVHPGPGGTMIVVEYDRDRRDLPAPVPSAPAAAAGGGRTAAGGLPAAGLVTAWAGPRNALPGPTGGAW